MTSLHVRPPSRDNCTFSPVVNAELLPLITKVASAVVKSVLLTPVSVVISVIWAIELGAAVSIVNGTEVAGLTLPAGSVSVTLTLPFVPSGIDEVGVTDHVPSLATVVVMISPVPGMVTVIVSPGVAPVPVMVGVVSLVMPSPTVPVSLLAAIPAAGAAGAVVSSTTTGELEPSPPEANATRPPSTKPPSR